MHDIPVYRTKSTLPLIANMISEGALLDLRASRRDKSCVTLHMHEAQYKRWQGVRDRTYVGKNLANILKANADLQKMQISGVDCILSNKFVDYWNDKIVADSY